MYTPRTANVRPAMRSGLDLEIHNLPVTSALFPPHATPNPLTRKPARRLTRNPVLAGIVNNAMRLWK